MSTATDATDSDRSEQMYAQVPLCDVPRHFAGMSQSPFLRQYLTQVLRLCPRGGRTCEIGSGSGYGAIWLSLRGIRAEGVADSPGLRESASQSNNLLGGHASFRSGNLFDLAAEAAAHYDVIHHEGVLERFSVPAIRAALARQVTHADWVVFSVPSVYYPFETPFGDERLLPLEEWGHILAPFNIAELRYCGDPSLGEKEHILCILRGRPENDSLRALMYPAPQPYSDGISAIVQTRNEARHITACLQTLQGWTDEIIVCDMESEDGTVDLARAFTDQIIRHPRITNFDRARNVSAMRAHCRWIVYLDADERVPVQLGQHLRHLVATQGDTFEAMLLPMRHYFAGHWMQCLYPGYTAPRLLKNGKFFFNTRLHSGAQVDGRIIAFPSDNPELAIEHFSYDSMAHYLDKMNRYTDGESENMHRDGQPFHWQNAIAHFVQDFQSYYDRGNAPKDGVHGLIYSFLGGFYRFEQHAKLYERRFHQGQLQEAEKAIPASVEEVLSFALQVCRQKPRPALPEVRVAQNDSLRVDQDDHPHVDKACVVWSGPIYDPSGYGEESRHLLLALDASNASAGASERGSAAVLSAQPLPWGDERGPLTVAQETQLAELSKQSVRPGFVQVIHTFAPLFQRHPKAGIAIGRTMFETDRLPQDWVKACNRMDYIWVPSSFNKQTFTQAGVLPEKVVVIPECLDASPYRQNLINTSLASLAQEIIAAQKFTFLTIFDWTWHKGWDVLLRSFLEEFEGQDDVQLIFKVWSSMGHSEAGIQEQAAAFARETLGHDLRADSRIRFVHARLDQDEMRGLYQASDCYVMPSRGEGWGRPYMEAMACGLPVIGTNWSGNTAFMTHDNSYLVEYGLAPVPERAWREVATYQGHRWAEPDGRHLRSLMRRVKEDLGEAAKIAAAGQEAIFNSFGYEGVGPQIAAELSRVWEIAHPHPVMVVSTMAETGKIETGKAVAENMPVAASQSVAEPDPPAELDPQAEPDPPADPDPHVAPVKPKQTRRKKQTEVDLTASGRMACDNAPIESHQEATGSTEKKNALKSSSNLASLQSVIDVRWEGAFFRWHSLAHVNRELVSGLMQSGRVNLSLVPTEPADFSPSDVPQYRPLGERVFAPLSSAAVNVRHAFPPRFTPPEEGHLVLMQPWEYGYLPKEWIAPIQQHVTEVWCNSGAVWETYRASGIAEEKLKMLPLGVDTAVFSPDAPPYVFTTEPGTGRASADLGAEPFTFLFVGGSLHRKGIDILLDAYLRAFSAYDAVRLIIKDTGTQTVYRGQNEQERILGLVQDRTRPHILYLEEDLSAAQLAGVYTAADCLVQPYRGEGFCLPALEAMACGLPVIVPEGGPTDDFVDESVGWRVRAARLPFGDGKIGPWECVGQTWMLEVSPDDLARLLRQVFQDRKTASERGEAALARVQQGWTWQHSCAAALERLQALAQTPLPQPAPAPFAPKPSLILPATRRRTDASSETNHTSAALPSDRPEKSAPAAGKGSLTISLCMIVRNEERVLGDCLSTIKPWVDEIIIVDTGSEDRTVEIAEMHGAQVFHFPWCDDFSAARNISLQHATGDWILWMDADDTIPEACGRQLKDVALLAEEGVTGLIMQVQIPPGPGEVGFTVVDHVKLFRNRLGLRFEGRIHEQILEPISRIGGKVERTTLYVVHSGYDYSPEGQVKKRARDLLLLEKDLAERPEHPFVLFNIGMTAFHMKDFPKAIDALKRCLVRTQPHESIVRKVYAMLAGSYQGLNDVGQAISYLQQGLALFPGDPELLFRAGVIYHLAGNLAEAEASYIRLMTSREQGHIDSLDVSMTGFKAHHNLALVYQDAGKWEAAEGEWRASVATEPTFVPSWAGLAQLYWQQGRISEHEIAIQQISQLDPAVAENLKQSLAAKR